MALRRDRDPSASRSPVDARPVTQPARLDLRRRPVSGGIAPTAASTSRAVAAVLATIAVVIFVRRGESGGEGEAELVARVPRRCARRLRIAERGHLIPIAEGALLADHRSCDAKTSRRKQAHERLPAGGKTVRARHRRPHEGSALLLTADEAARPALGGRARPRALPTTRWRSRRRGRVIERAREEIRAGADPGDLGERLRGRARGGPAAALRRVLNATGRDRAHEPRPRAARPRPRSSACAEVGARLLEPRVRPRDGRRAARGRTTSPAILRRLTGAEARARRQQQRRRGAARARRARRGPRGARLARRADRDRRRLPDPRRARPLGRAARRGRHDEPHARRRLRARDRRPRPPLLLRVHQSNFRVVGFTEQPSLAELAAVARAARAAARRRPRLGRARRTLERRAVGARERSPPAPTSSASPATSCSAARRPASSSAAPSSSSGCAGIRSSARCAPTS